jgi:ElaB/YqjD/DUF883 family membrane-anchored ribosome-binding protein
MNKKLKKAQIEHELHASLNRIKDAISDTKDGAQHKASEMLNDLMNEIKSTSADCKTNLEDYITDKPLKSAGIALITGLLLGKFIL